MELTSIQQMLKLFALARRKLLVSPHGPWHLAVVTPLALPPFLEGIGTAHEKAPSRHPR